MNYLLISDLHFHEFSAFSDLDENGVNTRLNIIATSVIESFERAKSLGIKTCIVAGDVTHRRGQVSPAVMNTLSRVFGEISRDMEVHIISGNHDLTTSHSMSIHSSITSLGSGKIFCHSDKPVVIGDVILFPWVQDTSALLEQMKEMADPRKDAIIHAGIDTVLPHLDGISPDSLNDLGYKRVFAGHYHNHKQVADGVYSIGALTHQTWSDVGSKAGYCLVYTSKVEHYETSAPKFIDLDLDMPEDEIKSYVTGNYVRVKAEFADKNDIDGIRSWLHSEGAKGLLVQPTVRTASVRDDTLLASETSSLEESVDAYIESNFEDMSKKELKSYAQGIVKEALS